MAYEKQTWECGETITAEKLNHIEDGIADASNGGGGGTAPLIVREESVQDCPSGYSGSGVHIMNVTFQQVLDAVNAGQQVYCEASAPGLLVALRGIDSNRFTVSFDNFTLGTRLPNANELLTIGDCSRPSTS